MNTTATITLTMIEVQSPIPDTEQRQRVARDYRAEYAARVARAAEHGLSRSQARGHARVERGERKVSSLKQQARALGRPLREVAREHRVPTKGKAPPLHLDLAGGRVTTSSSEQALHAAIVEAGRKGKDVVIRVTFDTPRGPRTRIIDGSAEPGGGGGFSGAGGAGPDLGGGERPLGKVQITEVAAGAGLDPTDFLDVEDDYGLWDALLDYWDAEVSG